MRLTAALPLSVIHALGIMLGWLVYLSSPRYAKRLRENLSQSGIVLSNYNMTLRHVIAESGKSLLEVPFIWFASVARIDRSIKAVIGWEAVEAAQQSQKSIIFLTPHLGCFEIAGMYIAQRLPLTILYRPPRAKWLEPLMIEGRKRGHATLATTDVKGVRMMYRALRRGEAIGLLPDQVPGAGEGVWLDFFARPAYTMTLVGRLAEASSAIVIMVFAERLEKGRGYRLHLETMADLSSDALTATQQINQQVEVVIRRCPTQYMWSYNRYKTPRGAPQPPNGEKFV